MVGGEKENMCKLTVIVPLYNGEKTIERCLKSLIKQNVPDMEILVVNDGSTDQGVSIVRSYIEKEPKIRMISQKNQGLGAARNFGIREAAGKYVGFVDCDDFVDPQMFGTMIAALERHGVSVAVCQEKNVYVNNGEIQLIGQTRFPVSKETVFPSTKILEWQLNYAYMSLNSMCYKVLERSIFLKYGITVPENYRHAEDIVASVGIFSNVDKIVVVPQSLYYYVHAAGSISYAYSLKHAIDIYLDWEDVAAYIKAKKIDLNMDNFSLGMYFTSLKQIYWMKDKKEKQSSQTKELRRKWEITRKKQKWKPDFLKVKIPFMHKIKICVAYFHICKPTLIVMKWLRWIPLFKYMT